MSLLLYNQSAKAQLPINDPAWVKDTALSDDFSDTTLNTSKWNATNNTHGHGLEWMLSNNVIISGGSLKIHADTLIDPNHPTYHYQSGEIGSVNTSYKYGYLEIIAKFPIGNALYWPGFWLWKNDCASSPKRYEEVDIAENGDSQSLDGHTMGTNIHWSNTNSCNLDNSSGLDITGLPRLDSIPHKYALQWDVDKLTFYFDDTPVRVVPNSVVPTPQHSLHVILDFYITPWLGYTPLMVAADFEILEFNYYKLNIDCDNDKTISNPSNDYYNATPSRAVKKSITTITVGGTSPAFNLSDNCTLRATDYILLDEGTTINASGNGQFTAIITPCPN